MRYTKTPIAEAIGGCVAEYRRMWRAWTDGVGFEPTNPCGLAVFKTAAINRSATHPQQASRSPADAIADRRAFPPFAQAPAGAANLDRPARARASSAAERGDPVVRRSGAGSRERRGRGRIAALGSPDEGMSMCGNGTPAPAGPVLRGPGQGEKDGQGNSVRLRHRRGRRRRLARLLWRRGLARRHLARPVRRRGRLAASASKLFRRFGIKTTWFIPGHSIETFPEQMQAVADAGHEIGVHGYSHENPIAMTPAQEEDGPGQMHRAGHEALRQAPDRLRRAVVGVQPDHQRTAAQEGHQVRPQPDAPRPSAVLRARRRHLDQDRLLEEGRRVDGAAEARPGDRPDRDSRRAGTSTICRR